MRKRWSLALSAALVAAVIAPGVLPRDADSFPFSHYPMYSGDRPTVFSFSTAVLRSVGGDRERLTIEVIANTDDPLIASALLRDVVRDGAAAELCQEIAARTDRTGTIEVVTEQHHLIDYLAAADEPLAVTVHATCET